MSRKSKAAEFLQEAWDIDVTGRNVQVTDAMKNYAIEKISKIEKFTSRAIHAKVIMDIQRENHHVDIIIKIDNIKIKATAQTTDMYASIDKAVDRLIEQIKRYKDKILDHHSISHDEVAMNVNVYNRDDLVEFNDEIEEESQRRLLDSFGPSQIVKTETCPLKTMTVNEAIIKMQLTGDAFMIFRGEEDRKIKVIYLRNDHNFGIIEPER